MIFAGLGSPIGRAVGMGFDAPVTEADFDQFENFYYSRKAPAQLDCCPLTDISLLEIARKRGYGIAELNNVLARKLDPAETFPPGPGARRTSSVRVLCFEHVSTHLEGMPSCFHNI
jgi:hypothetical protein